MTGNGTRTAVFDARGRMTSATLAGATTTYGINAFGQRITKTGASVPGGPANEYVYDGAGHMLGEYNNAGAIIEETVELGSTPVAVLSKGFGIAGFGAPPIAVTGAGGATVASISPDWLDAPHIVMNAAKQTIWTWDHLAFGDNAPNQNPSGLGIYTYNLRLPGQYADAETGLNYNYMRDYNPKTGRYTEFDPKGLSAGVNGYGYVRGNPLKHADPFGLSPDQLCLPSNATCMPSMTGQVFGTPEPPNPFSWVLGDAATIFGVMATATTYTGQEYIAIPAATVSLVLSWEALPEATKENIEWAVSTAGGLCIDASFAAFGPKGVLVGVVFDATWNTLVPVYSQVIETGP